MNKNAVKENLTSLAISLGLTYKEEEGIIYGTFRGYHVIMAAPNSAYPMMLQLATTVTGASNLTKDVIKTIRKGSKIITAVQVKGNTVTLQFANKVVGKDSVKETYRSAIDQFITILSSHGCIACCDQCGQTQTSLEGYVYGVGSHVVLCPDCAAKLKTQLSVGEQQEEMKSENVVAGIVGALIGSLIGVAVIILLSRLGYISVISGLIMAICVLKGYEKLAGKNSKIGVVICIVIMVAMTYVADRLDWAIVCYQELAEYDWSFFECYQNIPYFLSEGFLEMSNYVANLVLLYIALLVGLIPTIIGYSKEKKMKARMDKICSFEQTIL